MVKGELCRFASKQAKILKVASNPKRLSILMTIFEAHETKEPLYFTKLCKLHSIDEGLMTYHLRQLEQAGLITKRNSETLGDFYRVYSIGDRGRTLIEMLKLMDQRLFDGDPPSVSSCSGSHS